MAQGKELKILLELLEDDSEITRIEIGKQLLSMGSTLNTELARLDAPPSLPQRRTLQEIMRPFSRQWIREQWPIILTEPDEELFLERAFSAISEYLTGFIYPADLSILLDEVSAAALRSHPGADARDLASYLFESKLLSGAQKDYHHPYNSSLVFSLKEGRGIPLTLCLVYMLCGKRLGLKIEGCNFPGHFLARVKEAGGAYLVDCYNGGAEVDHKVVASMSEQTPWSVQGVMQEDASARSIIARCLANLVRSWQELNLEEDAALCLELAASLEPEMKQSGDLLSGQPRLRTGDVVEAPDLAWRGVIVDFDLNCKAPDAWYIAHGLEARKQQPWYHVFIHGTQQVGYAAEDRLLADHSGRAVIHPLIPHFFDKYENGKYWRNARVWPGTMS